jgi:hypothetical protein
MKPDPWNSLRRAFFHIDAFINKAPADFDPLALCKPGFVFIDLMGYVAGSVESWEKLLPIDHEYRDHKACYLLGLAAGLRHAQFPKEKVDQLIGSYTRTE